MSEPIDAIYENGVLRPLQPLALPEQARVKVTVSGLLVDPAEPTYQQANTDLQEHRSAVEAALDRKSGVTTPELLRRAAEAARSPADQAQTGEA